MRRTAVGWGWFIVALLASPNGHAVDLGELSVASGSGERLDGRIALVGAEGLRQQDVSVALGSEEDFGNHGLERFSYLDALRFEVVPPNVQITSIAPIPDAYLNFLVRLTWPGGAVVREYAVLLDALGAAAAKPQASTPRAKPETNSAPSARTVTVQPKDTLWSIAAANLPRDGTNVQQQMLVILRENPQAFVAGNINGLVAGAILRLPGAGAATDLSPQQAIDEASRQNDAWGSGGQLRIVDSAEDGPRIQAGTEPPKPETAAKLPQDSTKAARLPSEPPLVDLLQEARRQVREQGRQLQRGDDEIARLTSELAALRTLRDQERQEGIEALGRWRIAAVAGLLPTAGLIALGLMALRRRQAARRSEAAERLRRPAGAQAPDYDFGAPIGDAQVKLNMAKAYIDLNDQASAREVLEEVVSGGTEQERSEARALLERLAAAPPSPAQP